MVPSQPLALHIWELSSVTGLQLSTCSGAGFCGAQHWGRFKWLWLKIRVPNDPQEWLYLYSWKPSIWSINNFEPYPNEQTHPNLLDFAPSDEYLALRVHLCDALYSAMSTSDTLRKSSMGPLANVAGCRAAGVPGVAGATGSDLSVGGKAEGSGWAD